MTSGVARISEWRWVGGDLWEESQLPETIGALGTWRSGDLFAGNLQRQRCLRAELPVLGEFVQFFS